MHQIWIAIKTTAADMLRNLATPTVRNHASGTDTGGHRHPQQVVRTPHTPRGAGNSAAGEARSPRYRSACHRTRNAMRRLFSHLPFSNRLSPVSIRPSAAQTASLSAQTPDNPSRSSISQPAFLRRWILPLIPILSLLAVTPAFAQGTVTLAVSESGRVTEGDTLIITATLDSDNTGTTTLVIPLSVLGTEDGTTAGTGDYTALSNITIAAGARDGTTSFTVTQDDDDELAETVVVGIDADALSRVKAGDPNQVTITIVDNNPTTVTYSTLDDAIIGEVPAARSPNSNRTSFTVELSRELVDGERVAVTIGNLSPLGVSSTADVSPGTGVRITTDSPFSTEFPGVVFADAGAQSATVRMTAVDNNSRSPNEFIEESLLAVAFFNIRASSNLDGHVRLDPGSAANNPGAFRIIDDEPGLPQISLIVSPGGGERAITDAVLDISESNILEPDALVIRTRASRAWHTDIEVPLEVEQAGRVFLNIRNVSPRTVIIAENSNYTDIPLNDEFLPNNDMDEPNRIFSVSLQPGTGYELAPRISRSFNNSLGTSDHTVVVTDDDPTTVTLASAAGDVNEGGSKIFTVTLGRGLEDGESLSVPLVLGGTATFGTDYILSCAPATGITCQNPVAAGIPTVTFTGPDTGTSATVATLTLHALGDGEVDPNESVRIDLGDSGGGIGVGQDELEIYVGSDPIVLGGPVQIVDDLNDFQIGSDADTLSPRLKLAPVGGLTIEEGGSAGYTVVLEGTPSVSVTVTITGAPADLELSPSTLTFAIANWDQPQPVTVTARQDDDTRNDDTVLNHRADGGGDVLMFPFSVTVTDDDIIGITIRQSGGDTVVSETGTGGTDSYTVALGSRPSSNVTIAVTATTPLERGNRERGDSNRLRINVDGLGNALTFTPSNWNQPQIVTVSIPDDNIDQRRDRTAFIDHRSSSTDPDYQELSQSITVTMTGNDDTEGVTIMPNRVMVADDGTTVDTYTVVLNSQPALLGETSISAGSIPLVSVRATAPAGVTVGDGRTTGNTFDLTFVAANWNQPQTVTVTGIRDDVDTGMGTDTLTITHTIVGGDQGFYESTVTADDVTVIVQDDDMAGIVVPNSLSITEEGAVPYPVVLASEPSAEVTVTIAGDPDLGALLLNGSTLTITLQFTSSNWDQPQIVNVMAGADGDIFGDTVTLSHTASGATEYNNVQASMTVSVQDNDVAGVSVRPTGFDTAVSEAAGTDSYTVVLLVAPSSADDVVIEVTSGDASAATVEPDTLTFTTRNWNEPRMVIVTGVDDQIDNLNDRRTVQIDHDINTTDSAYSSVTAVDSVEVTVNDDDTAGVTVTVATPINIYEDGRDTGTYTVVLDSQPLAAVSIGITGGTTAAAAPETLEFATSNWNQPQTVTVTGINDRIDNANNERRVNLAHRISGAGDAGRYVNTLGIDSVPITVRDDNDFRGLVVEPSSATALDTIASATDSVVDIRMDEGEVTSYTVALSSQPTAAATVSIVISDLRQDSAEPPSRDGFIELAPTQLTFTPANWDQPQTVQITSLSNQGGARVRFDLFHQTTGVGSDYASTANVAYTSIVQVNSVPAVSVVAVNAVVTEGEAAVFSISAMPAPASTLTISLSIAEETGSGQSFVASDQLGSMDVEIPPAGTVTLSIPTLNDSSDEASGQITARISNSAGYNLNLSAFEAMVTVNDDDIPTVTITGDGAVNEGDPAVFTVEVSPAPAVELTVSLTVADATSGFLDTSNEGAKELTINAGSTTVSYSIDTVGDNVGESNGTVTVTVNAGSDYQVGDPGAATVVVNNDDVAGLDISETAVTVDEEGSSTYTVALTSEPTANVTVTITGASDPLTVDTGSTLTFDDTNWSDVQTVTLTAAGDANMDDETFDLMHTASGSATEYDSVSEDVTVRINDSTLPEVTIAGGAAVTEGSGDAATFTLTVEPAPSADLTVTVAVAEEAGQGQDFVDAGNEVTGISVTIDTSGTAEYTVAITDNDVDESNGTITVTIEAGSDYTVGDPGTATVVVNDDDVAGVTVTQSEGNTEVAESGGTDSYTVVLTSEPAADVEITVTSDDTDISRVAPNGGAFAGSTVLTFTATTWNQAQTVRVQGVDDDIKNASDRTVAIGHEISAPDADSGYPAALDIADVTVTVTDDDTAGLDISAAAVTVDEEGSSTYYTVALTSQPTAEVTVTITGASDPLTVDTGATLTFDDTNWSEVQTVTLTAADDANMDEETLTLVHTASGSATEYGSVSENVMVSVIDNDLPEVIITGGEAGVTVTQSEGDTVVAESGGTDSYTVVLTSEPAANVEITVTSDDTDISRVAPNGGAFAGSTVLTFTATTWNQAQTVRVQGVDDDIKNASDRTVAIGHEISVPDVDGGYPAALDIADVTVTVTDDDTAGLDISETAVTVDEEGSSTYTVALTSEPTAEVTVTITGASAPLTVDTGATLTFDDTNWSDVQTVTLTAADDANMDEETLTLVHTASGSATEYGSVNRNVTVRVIDNDSTLPEVTIAGGAAVMEGSGDAATFTLTADPAPSVELTVTVAVAEEAGQDFVDAGSEGTGRSVTISTSGTAEYTVAITDNDVDESNGTITVTIEAGSDYTVGDPGTATVVVNDDDTAGLDISEAAVTVDEEGSSTYTVALTSEPTANVTVTITGASDPLTVDTGTGATLTFDDTNWSDVQTVTLTAAGDANMDDEPFTLVHTASGSATEYGSVSEDVTVSVNDSTLPEVTIAGGAAVTEGGGNAATFTLTADPAPTADLTVTVAVAEEAGQDFVDAGTEGTGRSVTISTSGTAEYTVAITDNDVDESNGTITVTIEAGSDYTVGDPGAATVVVNDDDTAGLDISEAAVTVDEEGSSTYTVALTSEPTANVTVTITGASDPLTVDTGTGATLTFDDTNWSDVQTVTLTAADDANRDDEPFTLVHTASGSATEYGSVSGNVTVRVNDNDSTLPEVTIAGGAAVTEGSGDAVTFTLTAQPAPSAELTVTVAVAEEAGQDFVDAGTEGTGRSVTIGTSGTAEYTVAITDNDVDESNGTITVTIEAGSDYTVGDPGTATVVVNDDDVAGVTVTQSEGDTEVTESGGIDSYTVVLTSEPAANVEITVTSGDMDISRVAPNSGAFTASTVLTFTATTWNQAQMVRVQGVDDDVANTSDRTVVIGHEISAPDADSGYPADRDIADVTVTVTDDDEAGVMITQSAGNTVVAELGGMDSYTAVLSSEPAGNIVISVTSGEVTAATVEPMVLTFTTATWNVAQTVTVTGVNDDIGNEGGQRIVTVSHAVTTDDAGSGYPADLSIDAVSVTVTDDDEANVMIVESAGNTVVAELGGTDSYTVVLNTEPTGDVVIDVTSDEVTAATVEPTALTFTMETWNVAQTVTVTGEDDDIDNVDDRRVVNISHAVRAGGSGGYDAVSIAEVSVSVEDDDEASLMFLPDVVRVDEASEQSYQVSLGTQPIRNVTVTISGSGGATGLRLDDDELTFTAGNWNEPQEVTVSAAPDDDMDSEVVTLMHRASAGYGAPATGQVEVRVTDDDIVLPGVQVSPTQVTVDENGGVSGYDVVLRTRPLGDVEIELSVSGAASAADVEPLSLSFTSANWNVAQAVQVTGVNDDIDSADRMLDIGHMITTNDGGSYTVALSIDSVSVRVEDDDEAGIAVDEEAVTVTENNGMATYDVRLLSQPVGNSTVVISVTSDRPTAATAAPSALMFTSANWSTAQEVTVTGEDDFVDNDGLRIANIGHSVNTGDGAGYTSSLSVGVLVTVTDNEMDAGLRISPEEIALIEGSSDTYTVELVTQPTAPVTVTIGGANSGLMVDAGGGRNTLMFTSDNWNQAQTVTVTSVDDDTAAATRTVTLTHDADGDGYNGLMGAVTVSIIDNDRGAAVIISQQTDVTIAEGETNGYTVRLDAPPTANVQIQVLSSDPQVVSVESAILTFTPDNWATGQGVEITGVDDDIDNAGNQREAMIEHAVSADSGGYTTALEIDAIAVTVTDDDEAGLEFDPSRVTVVEGGSASYTVKLTSRPTAASVTVGIEPDSFVAEQGGSAIGVEPSELTFTSANWDTPQRVTLTAGRDGNSRDEEELPVRHSAMGGDYDFLTGVVTVDVADINRDAGVSIDRTGQFGITVTEGEVNDGYTIRLDAPPSGPVQIRMTSADPAVATVNPGVLTFTSDNWAISQRVTVTGVDDEIDSDDRTVMISHAASGGGYGVISVDPVRVRVLDNDEAGLVFVPDTLFVLESSSGAYVVHLATRPTANVTVSISGQANTDLTLSSDSLVFTSDNWDRPQAVTVAAGADDDSRHEMLRLTHEATGGGYDQTGVVTVNVADDENMTAGVNISPTTRLAVSEGGMVQYAMVLNAPPMSPVVITVTSSDEATAMTDSDFVTFTESNWGLPKVVTVTGVQDGSVIISHAIAERGADAATGYDISLAIPSVNVTVTSDEVQDSGILMPQEVQEVAAAQESYVSGFGLTAIDHMLGGLNYRFSSPAQLGLSGNLGSLPGGGGHALNATVAGPGIDGFGYGGKGRGASDAFGAGSVDRLFSLSRSLSLPDILRGSHFIFRDEDGISIWGQASYSSYKDGNDGILTDGDVTTGMLGVDRDNGRTLLGLALAYSKGDGDWNGSNTDGDFSSTLASLLPYVRHDLTDRLQLWGAVSYGRGELEQTASASGNTIPSEHDLDQLSASAGLRGTLMKRPAEEGGLTLTVTSDMSLARIETEEDSDAGMPGMKLDTQRFRMGLEWSWQLPQADDGSRLVPDLELGLRYDGGDTSDGFGIELGGGISWELPSSGLTIDLRGRHLLEHENSDRREWGISGSLRYDLQPGSAQGPSFSLRHQYGNVPTSSGLDELLSDSLSDSLKEDTSEAGEVSGRWTLKGEWGFALDSGATGVPYAGLSSSRSNHDLSVGWRLLSAPERELSSELDIKAIRRQDDAGDAKHSIGAEFKLRW